MHCCNRSALFIRLGCMVVFAMLLAARMLSSAALAVESYPATTSDTARQEATRAIPLANIAPKHRRQVRRIVHDTTVYRRLPTCMVECHPELFTHLAKNPEVMVAIWREMGISRVQLTRTGPGSFDLRDGAGTTGQLFLVEQKCDEHAQNRLVMLAEGSYEGKPLNRPIKAQCVLLLRSGSVVETNGRRYVAARLDTFIHVDRTALKLFAKALHPLVGRTADANFSDTMTFVGHLSHIAEDRPDAIDRLAGRLSGVPTAGKNQLVQIAYQCADDHSAWQDERFVQRQRLVQAKRESVHP